MGHFKKTNEWLVKKYGEGGIIDWSLDGKRQIAAAEDPKAKPVPGVKAAPVTSKTSTAAASRKPVDEFDDDEDAIEALEALANSSAFSDEDKENTPVSAAVQVKEPATSTSMAVVREDERSQTISADGLGGEKEDVDEDEEAMKELAQVESRRELEEAEIAEDEEEKEEDKSG